MDENKHKVITVLLVINAIITCYFGISYNKKLSEQNDMLLGQINNLNNSLIHSNNYVTNQIQSLLNESYNMIDTSDYNYISIDAAKNKTVLDLRVSLKAVNADSKIFLAYSEVDSANTQEIELTKKDGLSYGATVELDLNKNYHYDIIERTNGGGERLLNIHKTPIYLNDEFYQMRVQMHGSGSGRGNEDIHKNFDFSIDDFGLDEFGLDTVLLEVWYEGNVIDAIDITDRIEDSDISGSREHYNMAVASGQIDPNMSIEDFKKMFGYDQKEMDDTRKYYTYTHRIQYDTDYPDLKLDMDKAEKLSFSLTITCKDGYQYVDKEYFNY
jgi:hypothetical protein